VLTPLCLEFNSESLWIMPIKHTMSLLNSAGGLRHCSLFRCLMIR
jgi:hypothetical protein